MNEVSETAHTLMIGLNTKYFTRAVTKHFLTNISNLVSSRENGEINRYIDSLEMVNEKIVRSEVCESVEDLIFPSDNFLKSLLVLEPQN